MVKRFRHRHPVLYCILAEVIFLAVLLIGPVVLTVLFLLAGLTGALQSYDFMSCLQELVALGACLLMLRRSGRLRTVLRTGTGFLDGLLVGMFQLVISTLSLWSSLEFGRPDLALKPATQIFAYMASMMLIGIAEEFFFRGLVAQTLLEHFGTSRTGVWQTCLLTAVLFGCGHLVNIIGSDTFGVLMQCVAAGAIGLLLTAVYLRTRNIWVVAFLHGFTDIASAILSGLYDTATLADTISGYDASKLLTVLIYLIPTVVLLRRSKLPEIQLYWSDIRKK